MGTSPQQNITKHEPYTSFLGCTPYTWRSICAKPSKYLGSSVKSGWSVNNPVRLYSYQLLYCTFIHPIMAWRLAQFIHIEIACLNIDSMLGLRQMQFVKFMFHFLLKRRFSLWVLPLPLGVCVRLSVRPWINHWLGCVIAWDPFKPGYQIWTRGAKYLG